MLRLFSVLKIASCESRFKQAAIMLQGMAGQSQFFMLALPTWTVRPNPEGRIIRKPEGRILNHKAKMIINGKAEFDRKAENLNNLIYACYITAKKYG